jgi:hypothetical protein
MMMKREILNPIFCYENCPTGEEQRLGMCAIATTNLYDRQGRVLLLHRDCSHDVFQKKRDGFSAGLNQNLGVRTSYLNAESCNRTTDHWAADRLVLVASIKKQNDNRGLNMVTYLHRLSKCLRPPTTLPCTFRSAILRWVIFATTRTRQE